MEVSKESAENIIQVLKDVIDDLDYHCEDLIDEDERDELTSDILRLNDLVNYFSGCT